MLVICRLFVFDFLVLALSGEQQCRAHNVYPAHHAEDLYIFGAFNGCVLWYRYMGVLTAGKKKLFSYICDTTKPNLDAIKYINRQWKYRSENQNFTHPLCTHKFTICNTHENKPKESKFLFALFSSYIYSFLVHLAGVTYLHLISTTLTFCTLYNESLYYASLIVLFSFVCFSSLYII